MQHYSSGRSPPPASSCAGAGSWWNAPCEKTPVSASCTGCPSAACSRVWQRKGQILIFTSETRGGTRCQPFGCRHSPTENWVSIGDVPGHQEGWQLRRHLTGIARLLNVNSMDPVSRTGLDFSWTYFLSRSVGFFSGYEEKLTATNRDEPGIFHICPEKEKSKRAGISG
jgi:hypothetical protein